MSIRRFRALGLQARYDEPHAPESIIQTILQDGEWFHKPVNAALKRERVFRKNPFFDAVKDHIQSDLRNRLSKLMAEGWIFKLFAARALERRNAVLKDIRSHFPTMAQR